MRSFRTNPKAQRKKNSVEKQWKAVPSKPLETTTKHKSRTLKIIDLLQKYYPEAKCSLDFENPFQLLVATALSAQCTDKRVNMVTPELFRAWPTPKHFAEAELSDLENKIRSTGFYKNKAKNLKSCAKDLVEKHHSKVPKTMEELSALAGVGRKTANVILGNAFGIPGMVVDTHVTRLSNRLGMAKGEDAVKLERQLEQIVPKEHWIQFSHWLIEHGRAVCTARSPKCSQCFLSELCPSSEIKN